MSDVTGHNHDESGAPTYPDYRDRCPVGCDDLTPVRMADTNVQLVGKDRLVTRRLVPDGPSQFAMTTPPRTPTTAAADLHASEMRLVLVASADVLDAWGTRSNSGERLTYEWGEPFATVDLDGVAVGVYEPTFRTTDDGKVVVSRLQWDLIKQVVEVALEPTGTHRLINGYCPDCGGSCLIGFGNPA